MTPFTNLHAKNVQGQFIKDVLEHPPVMDCVIQHILKEEQSNNKVKFEQLFSLRLVFKLKSTADVIQYNINKVRKLEKRRVYRQRRRVAMRQRLNMFVNEIKELLYIYDTSTREAGVDMENVKNIYESIIKNKRLFSGTCGKSLMKFKRVSMDRLSDINRDNFDFRLIYGDRLFEQMSKI